MSPSRRMAQRSDPLCQELPGQLPWANHALTAHGQASLRGLESFLTDNQHFLSVTWNVPDPAQESSGSPVHSVWKPEELGRSRQRVMLSQPQTLYLSAKTWEELLHPAGQGKRESSGWKSGENKGGTGHTIPTMTGYSKEKFDAFLCQFLRVRDAEKIPV